MTNERASDTTRDSLKVLRQGLLRLHKALLDLERRDYERARGRISNSYEFLQLVLKDPWFDWLHRLSELIVQIDETLDSHDGENPATEADAQALTDRAKALLAPAETGSEFQKNYFLALQQSPDVVLLHSELMKLLR
ncbi:MAG TPA: hypothetical protein VEV42_15320 [Pyrinomonadaceae bacterium]|jgi:hypothetical protein|nr:hypothetical protein [Pyrinomonadaceae bacterium]